MRPPLSHCIFSPIDHSDTFIQTVFHVYRFLRKFINFCCIYMSLFLQLLLYFSKTGKFNGRTSLSLLHCLNFQFVPLFPFFLSPIAPSSIFTSNFRFHIRTCACQLRISFSFVASNFSFSQAPNYYHVTHKKYRLATAQNLF